MRVATVFSLVLIVSLYSIEARSFRSKFVKETFSLPQFAFQVVRRSQRITSRIASDGSAQAEEFTTVPQSEMKVGIVGAGISGLYAALLLQDLGIDYEILEASDRIGGRIETYHFDKKSDYNYVELGAMRFPKTEAFARMNGDYDWSLLKYLNSKVEESKKLKIIPFPMVTADDIFYFNGIKKRRREFAKSGDPFNYGKKFGGVIDDKYTDQNFEYWMEKAVMEIYKHFTSQREGYEFLMKNDYQTLRSYLMNPNNPNLAYPAEVVDWIEELYGTTGVLSCSLMEVAVKYRTFANPENNYIAVDGGSSRIIEAMASLLKNPVKKQHAVKRITQKRKSNNLNVKANDNDPLEYSHVIMTPHFSVMRDIKFDVDLKLRKRIAMRNLRYDNSVKVALQFKTRFWENEDIMNEPPIFGSQTFSDLPIRRTVYPAYGINCTECPGVLLASYTVVRDAERISGMSEERIVKQCLSDLTKLHGNVVREQYTGKYIIRDWSKNEWTQGAFALFEPGYFTTYFPDLIYPDAKGRLFFAGDSLSVHHGWTVGGLVSSYRAVKNILVVNKMHEKIEELESKWGKIEEPDYSYVQ